MSKRSITHLLACVYFILIGFKYLEFSSSTKWTSWISSMLFKSSEIDYIEQFKLIFVFNKIAPFHDQVPEMQCRIWKN